MHKIRDLKVFAKLKESGLQSLRKIAAATGLSKDSVYRALKGRSRRNVYEESELWETEEGWQWLVRLVLATILTFGLKGNQGGERLSEFFHLIRLEKHVGVSPTALRTLMKRVEEAVIRYGKEQESLHGGKGMREIVCGGDETFFNELVILVMMDLSSGYIIVEEQSPDRSYETWKEKAHVRLKELGLQARHFVSDRGKALVKLALDGLGCKSGAELFHLQYEISKWLGMWFYRQMGRAVKEVKKAEEMLKRAQEKGTKPEKIKECAHRLQCAEGERSRVEEGKNSYKQAQEAVSMIMHPFRVEDNGAQTQEEVHTRLLSQAQEFEEIAYSYAIEDSGDVTGKFKKQLNAVTATVGAWWVWVMESVETLKLKEEQKDWVVYILLPVIYWQQQLKRTQNTDARKAYRRAYEKGLAAWRAHSLTQRAQEEEIQRYQEWAEWICVKFQRSSSAIEGRNGCLAQMHHNGRGLGGRRLHALTVLHNFDTRREDGTTPAERLFEKKFPNLFEWLVDEIKELPMPRQA